MVNNNTYNNKEKQGYYFFYGGILSNFYPCEIIYDNKKFYCTEQLFMWLKAIFFKDYEISDKILNLKKDQPYEAKKLGRKVKNFNQDEWNKYKFGAMLISLREKKKYCIEYKELINKLKDIIIVEASPYDRIWGIGYNNIDALKNIDKWGENLLGKAHMKIRDNYEEN